MIGPLLFVPQYQRRPWGGRALASAFARALPADGKFGESWEIVDRPGEQSVVARGPRAGWRLRDLITVEPAAIMGASWDGQWLFPVLVKWLDCRERLSLQVHPPASIAASLGGEPKTENWFIARAEPGASLLVGLRRGVTRQAFERALASDTVEALVHRVPVAAGDSMFVRSGRVHAIDAGNLILEIQQNSDTTYRLYDWGRLGDDGRPRPLHVPESLRCIDFEDFEPQVMHPSCDDEILADCPEFRIQRLRRDPGGTLRVASDEPRLLSVVEGTVAVRTAVGDERYVAGDNVLLPADTPADLLAETAAVVLVTDRFSTR